MRRGILIARARTRARSLPVMVRPDRTIRSDTALTVPTVMVRPDRTIRSDTVLTVPTVMVRPDRTIRSDTALTVPTVMVWLDRTIRSDSAFAGMVRSGRTRTAVGECAQNHQTAAAAITTEYTP